MRFSLAPVQSKELFEDLIRQSMLAETLGFDALWIHEHHSEGTLYPSPLNVLSFLASKTNYIELGSNMLLLPLHHPVRVAEEAAMVDAQSQGRLRLGVSAGYSETDLQAFNIEARDRGKIMEEGVSLIRALWTEDSVTIQNNFSHLSNFKLFPKPVRKPSPPIYMGATVDAAVRRSARLGDEFVISTTQRKDDILRMVSVYDSELRSLGKDPKYKKTTLNRIFFVVDTPGEKEEAERYFMDIFLKLYQKWGHENIPDLDEGSKTYQEIMRNHFIIGEYSQCIDTIVQYEQLGINEICCLMNFGSPNLEKVEKSLRLTAKHIMPYFY